jgi:hypothetical protein
MAAVSGVPTIATSTAVATVACSDRQMGKKGRVSSVDSQPKSRSGWGPHTPTHTGMAAISGVPTIATSTAVATVAFSDRKVGRKGKS